MRTLFRALVLFAAFCAAPALAGNIAGYPVASPAPSDILLGDHFTSQWNTSAFTVGSLAGPISQLIAPGTQALPPPNGTNDTSNITTALAAITGSASGCGTLRFGPGTYYVSSSIVIYPCVTYQGSGVYATVIKLVASSNVAVMQTQNFASLTGTNSYNPGGPYDFHIQDLTIDGNSANNTSGDGLQIYGFDYDLINVRVGYCAGYGIYSEWSTVAAAENPPADGEAPTPGGLAEARLFNVQTVGNGNNGINWQGPHDSHWDSIFSARNNNNSNSSVTAGDGIYLGGAGYGLLAVNVHTWDGRTSQPAQLWGLYIDAVSGGGNANVNIVNGEFEGSLTGQLFFGSSENSCTACWVYGSRVNGVTLVQWGDGSHTNINNTTFNGYLNSSGKTGLTFYNLASDGGGNVITGKAYSGSNTNTFLSTNPASNDTVNVQATGSWATTPTAWSGVSGVSFFTGGLQVYGNAVLSTTGDYVQLPGGQHIYGGTGAPSFTAENSSIYVNYAGTLNNVLYLNTSGASTTGTTWTPAAIVLTGSGVPTGCGTTYPVGSLYSNTASSGAGTSVYFCRGTTWQALSGG